MGPTGQGDEDRQTGTERRTVVRAGALGAVGALSLPLLSACGGGGSEKASGPSAGQKITATSEVPVGSGVIVADPGVVVTQPTEGTFKGFSPICPHQGCTVSKIEGKQIECLCHGSRFSVVDGSVEQGPAQKGLTPVAVKVSGSEVVGA